MHPNTTTHTRPPARTPARIGALGVALVATAGAHAQLVTAYDGDKVPPRSWISDVTSSSSFVDGPLDRGEALAADNDTDRLFASSGGAVTILQANGAAPPMASFTSATVTAVSEGQPIGTITNLAFGNGVLYTYTGGNVDGERVVGLWSIDVDTGDATLLFDRDTLDLAGTLSALAFGNGRLYYLAQNPGVPVGSEDPLQGIYALDPATGESSFIADVTNQQASSAPFDGLAFGYQRLYLTVGNIPQQTMKVFNLVSGSYETPITSPLRFGNGRGGATFLTSLAVGEPLGTTGPRSAQIRSVDFDAGTVEVFNFGDEDIDLSRWRFCSHDFNQARVYSAPNGLNGVTLEAGTSVWVHFNNDAAAGDPDRLNRADVGAFATPLDPDAYGLQLFNPDANGNISFGNSSLIADHLQWNIDGQGAGSAELRTAQAVSQGLWSAVGDFIATEADSVRITLTDTSGDFAGSPAEYAVEGASCAADFDNNGAVNVLDVVAFVTNWNAQGPGADFNDDGAVNVLDVVAFIGVWNAGCP